MVPLMWGSETKLYLSKLWALLQLQFDPVHHRLQIFWEGIRISTFIRAGSLSTSETKEVWKPCCQLSEPWKVSLCFVASCQLWVLGPVPRLLQLGRPALLHVVEARCPWRDFSQLSVLFPVSSRSCTWGRSCMPQWYSLSSPALSLAFGL